MLDTLPSRPRALPRPLPRVLIIGHGRHGKDSAAWAFQRQAGFRFVSSSEFAATHAVFPLVSDLYADPAAAYADRANHRELWFHAIAAYNLRPGPMLAEQILVDHDIYVGMRSRAEFERSRHLFDLVVWVDRSKVHAPEPGGSNELTADDADLILDNNGDHAHLDHGVRGILEAQADPVFWDDLADAKRG